MKYTTIVLALLFCMLLTGCHGSEASSSTADGTTTVTTTTTTVTVSEQANDTSDSNIADTEIKTTTKKIKRFVEIKEGKGIDRYIIGRRNAGRLCSCR